MITEKIYADVAGLYFRSVLLPVGTMIPQHRHPYDHATYVGNGAVKLWVNGDLHGTYEAGEAILIRADCDHVFLALQPETRLTCVHHTASAEAATMKEVETCPGV